MPVACAPDRGGLRFSFPVASPVLVADESERSYDTVEALLRRRGYPPEAWLNAVGRTDKVQAALTPQIVLLADSGGTGIGDSADSHGTGRHRKFSAAFSSSSTALLTSMSCSNRVPQPPVLARPLQATCTRFSGE